MQLTDDVVQVLTPYGMLEIRQLAGWTLKRLSASSRISIAQLSLGKSDV
jgi:hypothetical protein